MDYIVITGASKGIGRALAYSHAEKRESLILVARTKSLLEEMKQDLEEKYSISVEAICCDLAQNYTSFIEEIQGYSISMVYLNAGFGIQGEFISHSIEKEMELIDLNIKSLVALSHYFGNHFKEKRRGNIVMISSVSSMIPGPFMASYYASKAYVSSFSYSLSYELKPYGIEVICCNMPRIDTEFDKTAGERKSRYIKKGKPASWAARKIIRSVQRKKKISNIGFSTKMTALLTKILPKSLFLRIMGSINK